MPKPCIPVVPDCVGTAWLRLLHLLDTYNKMNNRHRAYFFKDFFVLQFKDFLVVQLPVILMSSRKHI